VTTARPESSWPERHGQGCHRSAPELRSRLHLPLILRGDVNNAILAAAGYDFRRLICWLRLLLRQNPQRSPCRTSIQPEIRVLHGRRNRNKLGETTVNKTWRKHLSQHKIINLEDIHRVRDAEAQARICHATISLFPANQISRAAGDKWTFSLRQCQPDMALSALITNHDRPELPILRSEGRCSAQNWGHLGHSRAAASTG
jgi:hypothetical protein